MLPSSSKSKISQARSQDETASRGCFMLVSCLAYSLTQKVETTCSSETPVDFQQNTDIPEVRNLHNPTMGTPNPTL
jgi:hypothetical protein